MKRILYLFSNKLLLAAFISPLLYTIATPLLTKYLIDGMTYKVLTMRGLLSSIAVILVGMLWKKFDRVIYDNFKLIMYSEILGYLIIIVAILSDIFNASQYYLSEALIVMTVSKFIGFSCNKLVSQQFLDSEERRKFDDNSSILNSAGCVIGYLIGLLSNMSISIAFGILFIGISIDNILYVSAYNEVKQNREEINYDNRSIR